MFKPWSRSCQCQFREMLSEQAQAILIITGHFHASIKRYPVSACWRLTLMKQIHLIRAAQVLPFVRTLEQKGAPVRQLANLAEFPLDLVYADEGVIGEYSAWRFIELAANRERYDLFGYEVARKFPIHSPEGLGGLRIREAQSLKMLLEYFIEDAQAESTGCAYSLAPDVDGMWFSRQQMFGENGVSWQVEQYMITILIQIIRLCAGPKWLPPEIRISSTGKEKPLPGEWEQIKVTWGSRSTEIKIPGNELAIPPPDALGPDDASSRNTSNKITTSPLHFADLVKSQVLTNSTGLESAANQTGLSSTTLKRKLGAMKTSYSEILDQVKLQIAKSRLENPALPIHVIAAELGYRYPANFTRAFRRLYGLSPQGYRNRFRF